LWRRSSAGLLAERVEPGVAHPRVSVGSPLGVERLFRKDRRDRSVNRSAGLVRLTDADAFLGCDVVRDRTPSAGRVWGEAQADIGSM